MHSANGRNIAAGDRQRNIRPDGTVDIGGVARDVRANPAASYGAPEAAGTMLEQHGKMIQNATAQFQQSAAQNQLLMDGIGTLALNS